MTAHLDALVRELADVLQPNTDESAVRLRKGVVFAQSPLTVKIGGSDVAVPVQATGQPPLNGTVVWVLESGPRRILLDTERRAAASRYITDVGTVTAATLPQSYPEGFSIGYANETGGWPAKWGTVETNRRGTDVTQNYHAVVAGENTLWTRTASSAGNAWIAWGRIQHRADTVRYVQRAENLLMHNNMSGPMRYTGDRFSWPGRIIALGAGLGAHGSLNGYWQFNLPAVGTVIPEHGGGSNTVDSNGIFIGVHRALYGVPVIGAGASDVSYATVPYEVSTPPVPDHWILLAHRSEAGDTLRVMTGQTLGRARPAADYFINGTQGYDFGGVGSVSIHDGVVYMQGLVSKRAPTDPNQPIMILGIGYRPRQNLIWPASTSSGVREMRVYTDGSVTIAGGDAIEWVSIQGSWPHAF